MPITLLLSPKFSDLPSALISYLLNKTCFCIENNKHTEVLQMALVSCQFSIQFLPSNYTSESNMCNYSIL